MLVFSALSGWAVVEALTGIFDVLKVQPYEKTSSIAGPRCVGIFGQADSVALNFSSLETNTSQIIYRVDEGQADVAFCTNISSSDLDARMVGYLPFDPLRAASGGACGFDNVTQVLRAMRETCNPTRNETTTTIAANSTLLLNTTVQVTAATTSAVPIIASNISTTAPSTSNGCQQPFLNRGWPYVFLKDDKAQADGRPCAVRVESSPGIEPCASSNVRFYRRDNPLLGLVYGIAALLSFVIVIWELIGVYRFMAPTSENFGNLAVLTGAMEGTCGSLVALYLRARRGEVLSPHPDLTLPQFGVASLDSFLGMTIAFASIVSCPFYQLKSSRAKFFVLLLFKTGKFAWDTLDYLAERFVDGGGGVDEKLVDLFEENFAAPGRTRLTFNHTPEDVSGLEQCAFAVASAPDAKARRAAVERHPYFTGQGKQPFKRGLDLFLSSYDKEIATLVTSVVTSRREANLKAVCSRVQTCLRRPTLEPSWRPALEVWYLCLEAARFHTTGGELGGKGARMLSPFSAPQIDASRVLPVGPAVVVTADSQQHHMMDALL